MGADAAGGARHPQDPIVDGPSRCDNRRGVDPARKRKIRLVVALSAAVLLAAGLVYTSFSASTEAQEPSELLTSGSGDTYDLTGKVVPGRSSGPTSASLSRSPTATAPIASRWPTPAPSPTPSATAAR